MADFGAVPDEEDAVFPGLHGNLDGVEGMGGDGVRDARGHAARHVHRDG